MTDTWLWPDSGLIRVVDGDTFVARVSRDLGFHGTAAFEVKLRLNRINAPPVHIASGVAAQAALALLLTADASLNIETVGPYKYGDEWMAEVTLADGRNVSDAMVAAGHAKVWDGKGPRPGG